MRESHGELVRATVGYGLSKELVGTGQAGTAPAAGMTTEERSSLRGHRARAVGSGWEWGAPPTRADWRSWARSARRKSQPKTVCDPGGKLLGGCGHPRPLDARARRGSRWIRPRTRRPAGTSLGAINWRRHHTAARKRSGPAGAAVLRGTRK